MESAKNDEDGKAEDSRRADLGPLVTPAGVTLAVNGDTTTNDPEHANKPLRPVASRQSSVKSASKKTKKSVKPISVPTLDFRPLVQVLTDLHQKSAAVTFRWRIASQRVSAASPRAFESFPTYVRSAASAGLVVLGTPSHPGRNRVALKQGAKLDAFLAGGPVV